MPTEITNVTPDETTIIPDSTATETPDTIIPDSQGDIKTRSQDDINKIVESRLARAKKKWEEETAEQVKRSKMDSEERLKLELAEMEKKASDIRVEANRKLMIAELKAQAMAAGVRPDRLDFVARLVDIDSLDTGDEIDTDALKKAVEALLKEFPELSGTSQPGKVGSSFSAPSQAQPLTREAIINMTPEERARRMHEIQHFYKSQ